MMTLIFAILVKIRVQKRKVISQRQNVIVQEFAERKQRLNNQMILLLLTNAFIFFATTLPITFNKFLATVLTPISTFDEFQQYMVTSTIFDWILCLNYTVSYVCFQYYM